VDPGYFGFQRWLSGFVDYVSAPVIVPLILYLLFVEMGLVSRKTDYAGFALLWLFPLSAFRAAQWLSAPSPVMMVAIPALWSALALGVPAIVNFAKRHPRWYVIAPAALCVAALPAAAATSWWAFFTHQSALGFLLLGASAAPALLASLAQLVLVAMGRARPVVEPVIPDFDSEDDDFLPGDPESDCPHDGADGADGERSRDEAGAAEDERTLDDSNDLDSDYWRGDGGDLGDDYPRGEADGFGDEDSQDEAGDPEDGHPHDDGSDLDSDYWCGDGGALGGERTRDEADDFGDDDFQDEAGDPEEGERAGR